MSNDANAAAHLSNAALGALPEEVARPTYDRSSVTPGVMHFGVGNFHRSHQAMYIDALMNQGKALDWGICGVGVMPRDAQMRDALSHSDHLYTLVLKHPDGSRDVRVIGSIVDFLYAPDDPEKVIEQLASPQIRIVSLTVTEGGYNFDPSTGEFRLDNPAIAADLEGKAAPTTAFGLIVAGLKRRRERGIEPFTIMSCDNIQGNGEMAHKSFTAYAKADDPEFAQWLETHVSFPNSMVDRITPVTTDEDRAEVAELLGGVTDDWPVVAEPFTQWALEDSFPDGRPPLEDVGVQVVEDVEPYELMKLRLLNASHQGIAYFGWLLGYRLVDEAASDELLARYLRAYMDSEATPTLQPVPGVDLDQYKDTLIERFTNSEVRDTVARLAAESSDRIPKWLVPVIKENLAADRPVELSAAMVASWARYDEGVDEQGEPIEIVDQLADELKALAQQQADDRLAFVKNTKLFGDLAADERFTKPYVWALDSLRDNGARKTLELLVG
ncbi:mannitol dehydrogenase family protein [Naumannella halotolerans]|uniref:Mannitol-1-phosphate 5-dehydrogenase n=1 Tax=Naumannella halotolerans TaxID=993414 RepID=A0A4R7J1I5_9ACTN|nr:mannitol dehydrogenase family protein [Naumannella halotolerans]TDT30970.1 mannitol 2-dehydrogenase [Naumannella halotolerans]